MQALEAFGDNLAVLQEDEKFIFHPYTAQDDKHLHNFRLKPRTHKSPVSRML